MMKYICITLSLLVVTACASVSVDPFTSAEKAIQQAKQAQAELCAPELLDMAEYSLRQANQYQPLYGPSYARAEQRHDSYQATQLIVQAERYAKQAEQTALKGCQDKTTVILLPDEEGNIGQISLSANGGTQTIKQAFHSSSVQGGVSAPSAIKALDEEDVRKHFAQLLASQPEKALHFTLYFVAGKSMLTDASVKVLPQVIQAAKQRSPAEIHIVAHTDRVGSDEVNMKVSAIRAGHVQAMLLQLNPRIGRIHLRYHGENDPLVATPDDVAEPKNRRVEIMVL